ncbi:MAG: hypothetical protein KDD22_08760 [Bdellovibrionales bacterium]|nr:hypothetical protein [Bdellovibrionales bacterium]
MIALFSFRSSRAAFVGALLATFYTPFSLSETFNSKDPVESPNSLSSYTCHLEIYTGQRYTQGKGFEVVNENVKIQLHLHPDLKAANSGLENLLEAFQKVNPNGVRRAQHRGLPEFIVVKRFLDGATPKLSLGFYRRANLGNEVTVVQKKNGKKITSGASVLSEISVTDEGQPLKLIYNLSRTPLWLDTASISCQKDTSWLAGEAL